MHAHLDVLVDDIEDHATQVCRALELGATREGHQPAEGVVVMRAPYAGLFCLFARVAELIPSGARKSVACRTFASVPSS